MRYIIVFILIFNYAFAIRDKLLRVKAFSDDIETKMLYKSNEVPYYPEELSSSILEDEYNQFIYKGHFRAVIGKDYDIQYIKSYVEDVLDIANFVWSVEVEQYGFREPKNSDSFFIDIYIGNTGAFNKETYTYETVSSSYAGYATLYNNSTPYFIINPSISLDILKATIAHEFFHTIQYAYGFDLPNDAIWEDNIWFLEASAVMMEKLVYPDVDDYLSFITYYFNNTLKSITYHNGYIEYGKVVFAQFLKERYGLDFIKKLFENYDYNETILQDISKNIEKYYYKNFEELYKEYVSCVANIQSCLSEGYMYPKPYMYDVDWDYYIGYYGFALFNRSDKKEMIGSNPRYIAMDFNGETDKFEDINESGLAIINNQDRILNTFILRYNAKDILELKKGWNLISNPYDKPISLDKMIDCKEAAFVYKNGEYKAYTKSDGCDDIANVGDILRIDPYIESGYGAWIYKTSDQNISLDSDSIKGYGLKSVDGWQLISFGSSAFYADDINDSVAVWHYDNEDDKWKFYSNIIENDKYDKLLVIKPFDGYFVYRK